LLKAVVFSVSPKVRIEPTEPVRGRGEQRESQNGLIRIENGELTEKFLGFAPSFTRLQEWMAGDQRRVTTATNSTIP